MELQGHRGIVEVTAKAHGLDPLVVVAIATIESGGDLYRPRFEPQIPDGRLWFPREWASKRRITYETEATLQRMSWGMMQILGSTARWMGFDGDIPELCKPTIGATYACRYLKWCAQRPQAGDESWLIAAYNAGPGVGKTPGGMFTNQTYVDKVHAVLSQLRPK